MQGASTATFRTTASATAATAADVTALQADLAAVQADLDEILASANIYQDNVAIATVNDLHTFEDLGSNINIVNGNVVITRSAAMDTATLQAVIDNIFTINVNLTVTDVAATATNSFDNLTSVQNITMTNVNGAVSFAALTTAEVIDIDEDTDADGDGLMTSLSMPLLASATSIDGALCVPAMIMLPYKSSIKFATSGVDPEVTFTIFKSVLILSPGFILSGE